MSQRGEKKTGFSVEEPIASTTFQMTKLKKDNHCLEQELIRQEEVIRQLTQRIQVVEARNRELSVDRSNTLAELQVWNQTEAALRQKTEALAKSNQELEKFASLAAHDLQEPLHSIQVLIDLLRVKHGSSLNEQGFDYLNRVTQASSRMQQLIEGLLLYSHIDAPLPQRTTLPLKQMVQDILSDLDAKISELQAKIYVEELPVIHGDALHVRLLLQNLIGNGLKFHRQGCAPVLHISSKVIQNRRQTGQEKSRRLCQIAIEDQGVGIPEEHLEEIFGMFKRLHKTEEFEGAGIGLAVCQRIADQCGGTISVRSLLGEGSTFTVTLPVHGD